MGRQEILDRDLAPLTLFVIDEGALRRQVGGAEVMKRQFQALLRRASNPAVQIQVLSFGRGAHSAMNGPLVILDMDHAEALVYAETPGSG
ncbi:Scr1 family TA system antitoxin-like transcriptional regulator [Nocardiopsis sp. L17-MgMaSL7]|uniref:Scr1 family TA system antitoxin-like transcriptional regulator n=1 Tax=Nocardiopsis sp. L17-MgMaSL7 TaxID=1938893 RepID=UPI000D83A097|nr:Scr1 family TA system antitoxin-like transcriptional regulator [Nocardiopsis sp. L17-MgMaSL7]PWV57611.1 hypothetical protein BDW27_102485 [Nocardiopsis sp. L17-MgMaSL7]